MLIAEIMEIIQGKCSSRDENAEVDFPVEILSNISHFAEQLWCATDGIFSYDMFEETGNKLNFDSTN